MEDNPWPLLHEEKNQLLPMQTQTHNRNSKMLIDLVMCTFHTLQGHVFPQAIAPQNLLVTLLVWYGYLHCDECFIPNKIFYTPLPSLQL